MKPLHLGPRFEAWRYNTWMRAMRMIASCFGIPPICPCGWPLTQRFDGLWICGSCINAGRGYYDEVLDEWRPMKRS